MISLLIATLALLGSSTGEVLNTFRMPVYRRPSSILQNPVKFEKEWIPFGEYFTELAVGTPPQKVELMLDTGSSDLWVPSARETGCLASECVGGSLESNQSSTYRPSTYQPFNISYLDKSVMLGENAFDTVTVGDCSLTNFSFGVADDINNTAGSLRGTQVGILGLGTKEFKSECRYRNCTRDFTTPTISEAMKSAGRIASNSYSLFLDDSGSQTVSILFGGVDMAKFTGPLTTLRTIPDRHGRHIFQQVRLSTVTTRANSTVMKKFDSARKSVGVLLDTGSGSLMLPEDWLPGIYDDMQLPKESYINSTFPAVYCELDTANRSLDFTLADATGKSIDINIPFQELLSPVRLGLHNDTHPVVENGPNLCVFLVGSSGARSDSDNGTVILGKQFFKSAYTFFNLEQHTISIAKAARNSRREHIVAIRQGPVPKMHGRG